MSPWDGASVVGSVEDQDVQAVDAAIGAAHDAWSGWAAATTQARSSVLRSAAGLLRQSAPVLGELLAREAGKSVADGTGEILRSADALEYAVAVAQLPDGFIAPSSRPGVVLSVSRYPLGVVGIITPFNFPAFLPALKLGPALVAGNAVVWKPSPFTPLIAREIARVFDEAGLPSGVLAVVCGNDPALGARLVEHPLIRAISFTGSTEVGRRVIAAGTACGTPVQAEMGGVNYMVVLDDVDAGRAAECVSEAAFGSAGQKCTATRKVLVARNLYEEFLSELTDRAEALRPATPDAPGLAPVISRDARSRVHEQVIALRKAGGVVVVGGDVSDEDGGWFYPPTVLTGVDPGSHEVEIFGPVVQVAPVDSLQTAVKTLNSSCYGLSAGILTSSLAAAEIFRTSVRSGLISINLPTTGVEPHVPFGGRGDSGWGLREVGPDALRFYTEERSVATRPAL